MSILELAFAQGQLAAFRRPKLGWLSVTHPTVQESGLLRTRPPDKAPSVPSAPSSPSVIADTFDRHEQGETRVEPRRKLSADLCTTCRKPKHYGTCKNPIPIKRADFNLGMTPDASTDSPSTSPHYHSATTSDSALARARDGRPADEQAASAFADLFRNLGIANQADQSTQSYEGLSKVSGYITEEELRARGRRFIAEGRKLSDFMLPGTVTHSTSERRGPSPNPYEERLTVKSPPVAQGYVGDQAIAHAFGQVDNAADSASIEGTGAPAPGPLG